MASVERPQFTRLVNRRPASPWNVYRFRTACAVRVPCVPLCAIFSPLTSARGQDYHTAHETRRLLRESNRDTRMAWPAARARIVRRGLLNRATPHPGERLDTRGLPGEIRGGLSHSGLPRQSIPVEGRGQAPAIGPVALFFLFFWGTRWVRRLVLQTGSEGFDSLVLHHAAVVQR